MFFFPPIPTNKRFFAPTCLIARARSLKNRAPPMKKIDTSDMTLVHYGREWPHDSPPCSRAMVSKLERNERLVFWLQPRGKTEQDQVPALKLPDGFYSLSLRMMKAIWRHVRLKKGFHNRERAQLGGYKLRIPNTLLTEKIRTQSRFNVSEPRVCSRLVF